MSAEIVNAQQITEVVPRLQWGRTLMSAEIPLRRCETWRAQSLQWGRTLMSAEIRHIVSGRGVPTRFNGAAL